MKAIFPENILNKQFGRLTVISEPFIERFNDRTRVSVTTKCVCGIKKNVPWIHLRLGKVKSCGNHRQEINKETLSTHGLSRHLLYGTWSRMKTRCYTKTDRKYYMYGGRGITVCNEWKNDFMSFYNWAIQNGHREGLSIDRFPDKNGNYEPSNCRWSTPMMQAHNTRLAKLTMQRAHHIRILHKCKSFTNKEICNLYGVSEATVSAVVANRAWI